MGEKLNAWDRAGIGCLCFAAFVAGIYVPFGTKGLETFFLSQTTAAWVQAVGAIGAIVAAVLYGDRQHRRQVYEARRLEANRRQLDDLLKTEIVEHLFVEADSVCAVLGAAKLGNPEPPIYAALRRAQELEVTFAGLPAFELPGHGVAFGVLRSPATLAALREAANACVEERVKQAGMAAPAALPSRMELEFDLKHFEASKFFLAARLTCREQILQLKELTGAD